MGLGLHGGGLASARYCAEHGAQVTVTDLKSESELASSIKQLNGLPIRFVLGEHREEDFKNCDLVVKNPAIPRTASLLQLASTIETDISIFLQSHTGPVIAVTGSKGKSTTASAIHWGLKKRYPQALLGGNITTSPLSFPAGHEGAPVVLELSSFQLGDLLLTSSWQNGWRFSPDIAVLTNIMQDHQDYYPDMQRYIDDKLLICTNQKSDSYLIIPHTDGDNKQFAQNAGGNVTSLSEIQDQAEQLLPPTPEYKGPQINLLVAAIVLQKFGMEPATIQKALTDFRGIPHRMEHIGSFNGLSIINDTAATIPPAVATTVQSLNSDVFLIAGGADKNLDIEPFIEIHRHCKKIFFLDGSASERIMKLYAAKKMPYQGPFSSLEVAFSAAAIQALANDSAATIVLSPGAASFNMFKNEFDRGEQFRKIAKAWLAKNLKNQTADIQ